MSEAINITVSGWPGGGSTTLALLLSIILKKRFYHPGNIFRELGMALGYSQEGSSRPQFDAYIEPIIGKSIDRFVDYKLLNDSDILIESDIAAFRLGKHPKIFSIFLDTPEEERVKRTVLEGRENASTIIPERDKILREKYQELWQIDIFDPEQIAKKHNFELANINMSLNEEVRQVLEALKGYDNGVAEVDFDKAEKQIITEVERFEKEGKAGLEEKLTKLGLNVSTREMFDEISKTFPEDVQGFPQNVQRVFLGLKDSK